MARRKISKRFVKDTVAAYIFLLPVIVGTLLFTAYPIVMSLLYSFSDFNGAFATVFNFDNYKNIFSMDGEFIPFMSSLGKTFVYVICSTVVNMVLSYILALFLRKNIKGIKVIRLLCYLPCLIPALASGLIWRDAFAYNAMEVVKDYGIFNTWLHKIGLKPLTFFDSKNTAMITLIFTGLWGVGGGLIMWLAALENVSPDLYEAASLDGAGYLRQVFTITIPLTTNMLFYNLLTSVIGGLQMFNTFAIYGVGAEESLFFVAIKIYLTAFPGNLGVPHEALACAMSWILFIIIAALTMVMFKTNKWVKYSDE